MGMSIINLPFWGTSIYGNLNIVKTFSGKTSVSPGPTPCSGDAHFEPCKHAFMDTSPEIHEPEISTVKILQPPKHWFFLMKNNCSINSWERRFSREYPLKNPILDQRTNSASPRVNSSCSFEPLIHYRPVSFGRHLDAMGFKLHRIAGWECYGSK